jgi:hypothetical protein
MQLESASHNYHKKIVNENDNYSQNVHDTCVDDHSGNLQPCQNDHYACFVDAHSNKYWQNEFSPNILDHAHSHPLNDAYPHLNHHHSKHNQGQRS